MFFPYSASPPPLRGSSVETSPGAAPNRGTEPSSLPETSQRADDPPGPGPQTPTLDDAPAAIAREPRTRPGCLLAGLAAAVGALAGAIVAGLILVIVLAGDDSGPVGVGGSAAAPLGAGSSTAGDAVEAGNGAADEVLPPEGSTGDADFWSQVLANSNLFGVPGSGDSASPSNGGALSADGTVNLDPTLLADIWAQMLTGELGQPGSPLGSRIEGINVKAVLDAVQESVVIVKVTTDESDEGGGSGFVVAADGHIVTNEHVVRDAETVHVRLFGGELVPAEVVASDPTRDLAVLKVDRGGLAAARLGSTEGVEVGDEVIAIGNAFDIAGEPTVTAGIVSGLDRFIDFPDGHRLVRLIQTDAAINPGNSGGPLVNAAGEVIGVNTAIRSGFAEGIGYAISIDHARPIIDQLLEGVVQAKAYLGVRVTSVEDFIAARETPDESDDPGPGGGLGDSGPETVEPGPDPDDELPDIDMPPEVTYGALVVGLDPGHAADRAGIEAGDVIIEFEGAEIRTSNDLVVEILALLPGDRVEMRVIGLDGSVRTVELVLGSFVPDDTEG